MASLEAEPVVYMWDSERKDIDAPGYYRTEHLVFAESSVNQWGGRVVPLYTAPPAPVALAVLERLQSIVADPRALPRRKEWVSGQQYSYVLLENVEAMVDEACRTAMIHGAEPVSQTYKLNELSGNSPVTPDSWISCSDRMPNDAQWCVVNTEYGYYVQCWSEGQGWLGDDISIPKCDVINWMPLPEPPQEVK
ncbi:DUF551 domain-containing protein [Escherichia coli]|nr:MULTISPECIES: DUF551 domain-containing protein [Enterobacteriaceae]MCC4050260.1 DUF551 domain-containing protein [Escherichia coli]MCC4098080.1 DUF551 domain-containing protein [Escherichia coli]MCC4128228.1 DUF551 domain-containing protein [Escherichia coli]MCC4185147.1 DUF551 domain-containing protein [Escherichia coli]MCC4190278.1 DUF551 domain-containing protein [Escherichia coli]